MLDKDDLRITIKDVTTRLGMYSDVVVELLMGTCAVESNFGKYDKQINGPALGYWQMEPATMRDIWYNYIRFREGLKNTLLSEFFMDGPDLYRLQNDIEYGIVMARLKYRRSILPLPHSSKNLNALASYWKRVYNTSLGKGRVEDFINKYNKYCT